METSDWINLIAAILVGGGTLFLGIMAWRAIRQTRNIQKAEKRERLLNEIIDWAIDVSRGSYDKDMTELAKHIKAAKESGGFNIEEWKLISEEMIGKNRYISSITFNFEQDLQDAANKLVKDLKVYIDSLLTEVKRPGVTQFKILPSELQIYRSANKVIEEASKIKTKEIS